MPQLSLQTNGGKFDISKAEVLLQQYFRNTGPQNCIRVSARNRAIYKQIFYFILQRKITYSLQKEEKWNVRWPIHSSTIQLFTYLCNLLDFC